MSEFVIKNLPGLLKEYVGPKKHIVDSDITTLTVPGENYGSVMLKVDLTVKNLETGGEEILYAVAKTFKHEAALYTVIVPTLRAFQEEVGVKQLIDWSPDVYGARLNLNGSDVVDEDACLILENLKVAGFENIDRSIGFDLETSKLVLKSLASFHAVPLALKLRKPKLFEEKVNKFYGCISPPAVPMENFIRVILDQNEKFKKEFSTVKLWPEKRPAREPFATLTHWDLWVNNTMQIFDNGKPIANKILDFQCIEYGSPAADVFLYLFSSVQRVVLEKHLDVLLEYYHHNFFDILEAHGCDITPFNYEAFLSEMKEAAKCEFGHTFIMTIIAKQSEDSKKDLTFNTGPTTEMMMKMLTESGRAQVYFLAPR